MRINFNFNRYDGIAGIYFIKCLKNSKMYVGSSVNLITRLECHRSELRGNYHGNRLLQRAYNKYGEESFIVGILEKVEDRDKLLELEQYYIDKIKPEFNLCFDVRRHSFTEESRKKLSNTRKKLFKEGKITPSRQKAVKQYDLVGNFIKEYQSISQAARETGIKDATIYKCAKYEHKQGKGFIWRYSTDTKKVMPSNKKGYLIKLIDTVNKEERIFTSKHKCAKYLNTSDSCLDTALKKGTLYKKRFALVKLGEFRGNPEVDNPEPSL